MGDVRDELFKLAHQTHTAESLVRSDKLNKEQLSKIGVEDLGVLISYVGVPAEQLYYTGNFLTPFIAWDGGYTTLEIPTMANQFDIYKGAWLKAKELTEKLLREERYDPLFTRMTSGLRIAVFNKMINEMPDKIAYETFKSIYKSNEYRFDTFNWEDIKKLCYANNSEDIEDLSNNYGSVLKIYRGVTEFSTDNYSWTLDRNIAEFFSQRFDSDGIILRAQVETKNILTTFDTEGEILVEKQYLLDVEED